MKLYMSPGACSLAPHIILRELDIAFAPEVVNIATGKTASGADFRALNPKGYVPALALDNGEILTEVSVILQYLAAQNPDAGLLPTGHNLDYFRCLETLAFVSTEVHKGFSSLFNAKLEPATREATVERLLKRVAYLDAQLADRTYLMGEAFSIPDAYLYTVLSWAPMLKVHLGSFSHIARFREAVAGRPAVKEALKTETELRRKST